MSFFKNVLKGLTAKNELTEPKLYYSADEESSSVRQLQRLVESQDPSIDVKKVEDHLKLFAIGQSGEKNVLYELQHTHMPMLILHDLYIEYKNYSAQLDFVVITRQFILLLEVKRLFGNIHVTEKGEFQRVIVKNNRVVNKEGMYSPINQVRRQVSLVDKLLKENKLIKQCPVTYAVTFANPKTIIDMAKKAPRDVQSHVIRHDQITSYLASEVAKNSPVDFPDFKMYEIADMLLKYRKDKVLNLSDYTIQTEVLSEEPTPQIVVTVQEEVVSSSDNREELRASLSEFRKELAKRTNRKAYYIFTNQTLESLLDKQPQTRAELMKIDGIGPKKVEEFGDDLLVILSGKSVTVS
ncbi:HRDC domain-containing protein [Chryseomicrobium sp. FSL W7-1435]|uniref:HRDC domain-containing protein n=1 Tax=Chryseomicrobium sp. FSL W7-1435 TaxID=2921704 RepID=UPI00315A7C37